MVFTHHIVEHTRNTHCITSGYASARNVESLVRIASDDRNFWSRPQRRSFPSHCFIPFPPSPRTLSRAPYTGCKIYRHFLDRIATIIACANVPLMTTISFAAVHFCYAVKYTYCLVVKRTCALKNCKSRKQAHTWTLFYLCFNYLLSHAPSAVTLRSPKIPNGRAGKASVLFVNVMSWSKPLLCPISAPHAYNITAKRPTAFLITHAPAHHLH